MWCHVMLYYCRNLTRWNFCQIWNSIFSSTAWFEKYLSSQCTQNFLKKSNFFTERISVRSDQKAHWCKLRLSKTCSAKWLFLVIPLIYLKCIYYQSWDQTKTPFHRYPIWEVEVTKFIGKEPVRSQINSPEVSLKPLNPLHRILCNSLSYSLLQTYAHRPLGT